MIIAGLGMTQGEMFPGALLNTGNLTTQFSGQPASETNSCAILIELFYYLHRAGDIDYEGSV